MANHIFHCGSSCVFVCVFFSLVLVHFCSLIRSNFIYILNECFICVHLYVFAVLFHVSLVIYFFFTTFSFVQLIHLLFEYISLITTSSKNIYVNTSYNMICFVTFIIAKAIRLPFYNNIVKLIISY